MSESVYQSEVRLLARITTLENEIERQRILSAKKDEQLQTWLLSVETTLQQTLETKNIEISQLHADVEYYKALVPQSHYLECCIAESVVSSVSATYGIRPAQDDLPTSPDQPLNLYPGIVSPSSVYGATHDVQPVTVYSMLEQLRRDVSAFSPRVRSPLTSGSASNLQDLSLLHTASPLPSRSSDVLDSDADLDVTHHLQASPPVQPVSTSATISDLIATFNALSLTVRKPCADRVANGDNLETPTIALPPSELEDANYLPAPKRSSASRHLLALADTENHLFTPDSTPAASGKGRAKVRLARRLMGSPHLRLVVHTPHWREKLGCRTPVSPCWGIGKGGRL